MTLRRIASLALLLNGILNIGMAGYFLSFVPATEPRYVSLLAPILMGIGMLQCGMVSIIEKPKDRM
jgi:hypothetical protein